MTRVRFGWPMTPVVKRLLIALTAVWLAEVIGLLWLPDGPAEAAAGWFEGLALVPAEVLGGLQIWRPLTYMWLHDPGGVWHLLMNGLFLWMFGGALEQSWGSRGFFVFYFVCGIGAGLTVLVVGSIFSPETKVIGASGAIYGLVVAWAIAFPDRVIYLFGVFPIRGRHFALIPIGFALVDFLLKADGVSHSAHLGGMAVGALLVTGWWRPSRWRAGLRRRQLKRRLKVIEGELGREDDGRPPPADGGYWH